MQSMQPMPGKGQEHASDVGAPANKRRRIALACNACRMRKSRCDGQRPSCSSCVGLGFVCQYEPTDSATNVLVRKEYLSDLEQRMTANERKLQQLDHLLKNHLSNFASGGPSEVSAPSVLTMQANELEEPRDEDATTNGMAMTFLEERTPAFFGESSNLGFARLLLRATVAVNQSAFNAQPSATPAQDGVLVEYSMARLSGIEPSPLNVSTETPESALTALPSSEAMENMIDIFFDHAGMVFPFIHEETLRQHYAEFKANGFTKARRTWLGMLNMTFAIAAKFDQSENDTASSKSRFHRSDVFYKRANRLCGELAKRVISLEIVHYLILVVIHCQGTQRSVQAWNLHGLLVRSAIALGLHSDHSREGMDADTAEAHCRTWLVIYGLDKLLSMVFGRPMAIMDEQMVPLAQTSTPIPTLQDDSDNMSDFAGQFLIVSSRLYQIMGMSLIKQYGGNVHTVNLEVDDLSLLQTSDEIRKGLRLWMASLPPGLQLCSSQSSVLFESSRANRLRVILTLRYHNLNILVHRPLLSAVIRHLSRTDIASRGTSPYIVQLARAGAHECTQSAEATIDMVQAIVTTDATTKNNLGVWFFTLYYVFTASLVISGQLLVAKHGQDPPDEATINHAQQLLDKSNTIFQKLSCDDTLVYSCSQYIRNLSDLYTSRAAKGSNDNNGDQYSTGAQHQANDAFAFMSGHFDFLHPNAEVMDAFLTSEMIDPSIFEGF